MSLAIMGEGDYFDSGASLCSATDTATVSAGSMTSGTIVTLNAVSGAGHFFAWNLIDFPEYRLHLKCPV